MNEYINIFKLMSPLKKGELLEKETVETVERVMLFKINPRLSQ